MTITANGVDYMSAPADYAALYRDYYLYVVNLVAKHGIDENNKEDVASDILLRMIERDILGQFDPTLTFEYEGQKRPARFRSFLGRAVTVYVRGHYDKQMRIQRRELQICDTNYSHETPGTNLGPGPISTSEPWSNLYATPHEDHADGILDMIVEEKDAEGIRLYLKQVPPRSPHDTCDLVGLFDAMRIQGLAYGECDIPALEKHFGICTTTLYNWIWWLRSHLAHIYGRELPRKRARTANRRKKAQP